MWLIPKEPSFNKINFNFPVINEKKNVSLDIIILLFLVFDFISWDATLVSIASIIDNVGRSTYNIVTTSLSFFLIRSQLENIKKVCEKFHFSWSIVM